MNYLKKFENFSTDYYMNFNDNDFPMSISFKKPHKVTYKRTHLIPGSNKVFLKFELSSEQPEKDNPYSGDIPSFVTMEIGITYKEEGTKIYVTIIGGNRTWWSFSYENKEVKDIETSDYELSKSSISSIKKIMKKYSKSSDTKKL